MTTTVVGVFNSDVQAQDAVRRLQAMGVSPESISVIARTSGESVDADGNVVTPAHEDHMSAGEGLTVGAVWGGLVGIAALAIPGIGPLIGSGILAAALTGAVAGAATGGIAGALIDAANVSEDEASVYEDRVRAGGTLVTVRTDDEMAANVRNTLHDAGAERFDWSGATATTTDYVESSDEAAYADSSKVGTVGGGAAGAMTGAAIGAAGGPVGAQRRGRRHRGLHPDQPCPGRAEPGREPDPRACQPQRTPDLDHRDRRPPIQRRGEPRPVGAGRHPRC